MSLRKLAIVFSSVAFAVPESLDSTERSNSSSPNIPFSIGASRTLLKSSEANPAPRASRSTSPEGPAFSNSKSRWPWTGRGLPRPAVREQPARAVPNLPPPGCQSTWCGLPRREPTLHRFAGQGVPCRSPRRRDLSRWQRPQEQCKSR